MTADFSPGRVSANNETGCTLKLDAGTAFRWASWDTAHGFYADGKKPVPVHQLTPVECIAIAEERERIKAAKERESVIVCTYENGPVSMYDKALDALGKIIELGDSDEEYTAPQIAVELERIVDLRESTYIRHCRNKAGSVCSEEAFKKAQESREQMRDATLDIAFKLESRGRRAFADPKSPAAFIVDPLTGRFQLLPNVMGRKIFPTVAAMKRAPMLAALEMLLRSEGHEHDLFCTFTGPERVPVYRLRAAVRKIQRKLSKLNGEPFMRDYGAKFIFRATEIGTLTAWHLKVNGNRVQVLKREKDAVKIRRFGQKETEWIHPTHLEERDQKDANGVWLFHPHCHALLHLDAFLPFGQMRELTERIWSFWGDHWSIDGAIESIREACKYPVKPADLGRLDPDELVTLDYALLKLHLVQPLGVLREQIGARRRACLTVKREYRMRKDENGEKHRELVPVVISDWNARKKNREPDPEAVARRDRKKAYAKKCEEIASKNQAVVHSCPGEQPVFPSICPQRILFVDIWTEPLQSSNDNGILDSASPAKARVVNRVTARLSPAPYFDRVSSPALLVHGYNGDLKALLSVPCVQQAVDAIRAQVTAARAGLERGEACSEVSVHTSPVTVRAETHFLPGWGRSKTLEEAKT